MSRPSATARIFRGGLASAGALAGAFGMMRFHWGGMSVVQGLPAALLAASAVAVHAKHLAPQVLSRALWVATLLLSVVNLVAGPRWEHGISALMAAGMATALLAAGRRGLDADAAAGPFKPVAFRGLLLLSLGMALTDAHTLLFYGVAWLERLGRITPPLVLGSLLLAVTVGLFRLRTWALLATLAVNATVLAAVATGLLMVPGPVLYLLAATATLQLLVPIPILRAIVRKPEAGAPMAREGAYIGPPLRIEATGDAATGDARDEHEAEIEALAAEAGGVPFHEYTGG